jgi:hypothetical protein
MFNHRVYWCNEVAMWANIARSWWWRRKNCQLCSRCHEQQCTQTTIYIYIYIHTHTWLAILSSSPCLATHSGRMDVQGYRIASRIQLGFLGIPVLIQRISFPSTWASNRKFEILNRAPPHLVVNVYNNATSLEIGSTYMCWEQTCKMILGCTAWILCLSYNKHNES